MSLVGGTTLKLAITQVGQTLFIPPLARPIEIGRTRNTRLTADLGNGWPEWKKSVFLEGLPSGEVQVWLTDLPVDKAIVVGPGTMRTAKEYTLDSGSGTSERPRVVMEAYVRQPRS